MRTVNLRRQWWVVMIVLLGAALGGVAAPAPAAPPSLKSQYRGPWPESPGEWVKNWLVCGRFPVPAELAGREVPQPAQGFVNDYLQGHGGEAGIRPLAGMTHLRPDGTAIGWKTFTATNDWVDLKKALPTQVEEDTAVYAFAALQRKTHGEAVLLLNSRDAARIWVNGKLVLDHYLAYGMAGFTDLVPVTLHAGENALLVKLVQHEAGGGFTLRILEPAQAQLMELTRTGVSPTLAQGDDVPAGSLVVITDSSRGVQVPHRPPVEVQVFAPGGRQVAAVTVPRGERAAFTTANWADGPYEIRTSTRGLKGQSLYAYLYWYQGDALAAAKRLVETAPAATTRTERGMIHRMLADLVVDRLGKEWAEVKPEQLPSVYPTLLEFAEMPAATSAAPVNPLGGLVRLVYRDPIDDAPQFCRVYLPPQYDPAVRYPLIVSLHGRADTFPPYYKWGGVDQRHDGTTETYNAITVYPHGRGNTWYRGLGEMDVLRCLALVKERFSVDEDRTYLLGYSMGGAGVWYVGTRHPELFAALAPNFGGYDFRFQLKDEALAKLSSRELYRRERMSYIAQVEGLRTTPIFANHGDTDEMVSVDYSRYTTRTLQRWGYDIRYWEQPGKGHGGLYGGTQLMEWLLAQRRTANPPRVSVRAAELRSAAAHWVTITQREHPYAFMRADAEVLAPNVIRLDTDNVLALTLAPAPPLIDPAQPVQVVWNGKLQTVTPVDGALVLRAKGYTPQALFKRAGLEGPAIDLFNTPFIIVTGTASPNPLMRRMCARAADRLAAWWTERMRWRPRAVLDTEISEEEQARYSLLLIGGPAENLVARRLQNRIPLAIAGNAVTIDGHSIPARDAAVQMVYPNPLNPDRYVVIRAATSATGMFFADYVMNDVDFCVVDGRHADPLKMGGFFDVITGRFNGPVLFAGYFDYAWRYQLPNVERDPAAYSLPLFRWKVPTRTSAAVPDERLYLSDLLETRAEGAFLDLLRDCSMTGKTLTLGRRRYGSGLAVTPQYWLPKEPTGVEYDLTGGGWTHLRGVIGLELGGVTTTPMTAEECLRTTFIVKGDGVELYRSEPFTLDTPPQGLDVDIAGVHILRLELETTNAPKGPITSVDWADLRVER